MRRGLAVLLCSCVLTGAWPGVASAMQLLDWPVRVSAGPEALASGSGAVFWNPARIAVLDRRAELSALETRAPAELDLGGLAVAWAARLNSHFALAAGYQHARIDGIPRTTTSPLPDAPDSEIRLVEDVVVAALAFTYGEQWSVGVGGRFAHWNAAGRREGRPGYGAGAVWRGEMLAVSPVVAMAVHTGAGPQRFMAAVDMDVPVDGLRGNWGVIRERRGHLAHRFGLSMHWAAGLTVSGGLTAADAGDATAWDPLLGASVALGRYRASVVREELLNGFGAVYSYRIDVLF